jgi:hypothetical protein
MIDVPLVTRLENYTLKHPQEVLIVHAQVAGEADEILIFKGFSSSLMRPTAFDLEVPTLPPEAEIWQIDRLSAPYQPQLPQYLEQGLSLQDFIARLNAAGI